ncbi:FadR/GntR family transcriptional regulator [Corynebacterium epidermidicanis]|uniref:Transcriptional regulator n=1 Tax=Corynebacterium epidermidicanis TaxID=1050174 RepID=A0A0G3GWD9_9CORY|nr:GntR family transcriptional regulator [Corynebacterium epidermidicanis]AKK03843.1 transcriptional regulator [Corynebacterium epidermidicanis]
MSIGFAPNRINPTASAIENYIRDNELRPGELMPSEAALCDLLDVSRSSVREAMRMLSSLDVVEIRHGHGTYVGNMSLAPLVNGLTLRLTLDRHSALENLKQVVDTRIAFDQFNAPLLIEAYRGKPTTRLRELVVEMQRCFDAGKPITEADGKFHEELNSKLSNQLIQELYMALWEVHTRAVPLLELNWEKDFQDTVDAHLSMVEALEAGDEAQLLRTFETHYGPLKRMIDEKLS